jgi:hypothetical protein
MTTAQVSKCTVDRRPQAQTATATRLPSLEGCAQLGEAYPLINRAITDY